MTRPQNWLTRIDRDGRFWWIPLVEAVAWASGLCLAVSSQFLLQPVVWRTWSLGEILQGWLRTSLANAAVVFTIVATLAVVGRVPLKRRVSYAAVMGLATLLAAFAGAALSRLVMDQPLGLWPLAGEAVRWTVVCCGLTLVYYAWLNGTTTAAAAAAADQKRAQLQRLARQTELDALQRQIEPHFLFNTLATARGLYRKSPERGAALLANLAAYMKASLGGGSGLASLGRELDLVSAYLGVCSARMEGRLAVTIDVDARLRSAEFPPLALATLVENAIIHGLEPHPPGGTLTVRAHVADGRLEVQVEDDGRGFTSEPGGSGIGLANTRARLTAMYGTSAGLRLASGPAGGVRASLWLPQVEAA